MHLKPWTGRALMGSGRAGWLTLLLSLKDLEDEQLLQCWIAQDPRNIKKYQEHLCTVNSNVKLESLNPGVDRLTLKTF